MMIDNSKGKIWYGLHFYPGVAEYAESGKESYRVFLNENTLRSMDATFAGKPVFVEHVENVEPSIDELRKEADGWVVESFFNQADGKHWVKLITVSERADRAIKNGFKLSNAYVPKSFGSGGTWNGVSYAKEIVSGEYEHLAIVSNPRYEESVIMTPEQFKKYNSDQEIELKRISNSKEEEGDKKVKLNFFKRSKVENSADLESTVVELPKSKVEITVANALMELDTIKNMHGYANGDHLVKVGEKDEMSVNDLVKKHMDMCNEMDKMKAEKDGGEPGAEDDMKNDEDQPAEKAASQVSRGGDKSVENKEDEDKKEEVKKNEAKAKAAALKNARPEMEVETASIDLSFDKTARGKAKYGSN